MLYRMKNLIFLVLTAVITTGYSQDFGVGSWREHLPYKNVIDIAQIGNKTYGATNYAVYYHDEDDGSLNRVTKVNALSDFSINTMQANDSEDAVVIGYASGNIDIIKNDRVINVSAIINSNIVGDRAVYNMHNEGRYAYLACGFGIVVLDVRNEEIKDTYIIGSGGSQIKINDIAIDNDSIYAATNMGIYQAHKNTPFLSDHTNWSEDTNFPHSGDTVSMIAWYQNKLFANFREVGYNTDTLYYKDGTWNAVPNLASSDYHAIEPKDNNILISHNTGVIEMDGAFQEVKTLFSYAGEGSIAANTCIWDGTYFWLGDKALGMSRFVNNWNYSNYLLPGPNSNEVFHLATKDDMLWVSTGRAYNTDWNNSWRKSGVYKYDQYDWSKYNFTTHTGIPPDSVYDFVHTSIHPSDKNHVFASTFGGGLIEIQDNQIVNRFTYYNSTLQESITHGNNQVKVAGSDFDDDKNLWISNSFTNEPLSVYTKDGEWYSFDCGNTAKDKVCTDILIDNNYNYVWMAVKGVGLLVYDFNDTPSDPTDDQYRMLTTSEGNGNLPNATVNTITEDRDGEIWIGTNHGPAVIYNPPAIFDGNGSFDAQQILLEQEGVIQLLLETEVITEILIDGGNRKWFATLSGGLFLMSEDGTELIHSFTTENSPLFSNEVLALAMNDITGELYVGTDLGIMGYKGEATEPTEGFQDVYAYPNPVRSDYTGPIAIKGLMEESDVKITDASGNLVYSGTSVGGQFVWNGLNLQGERVQSGVYYAFAASRTGLSKSSTKILFIH